MDKNYISQLKALIAQGGMTQGQLAAELRVTFAALNRWVNGHAVPHPAKRVALRNLFRERVGYPSISEIEIARRIREAESMKRKGLWKIVSSNEALQEELLLEHTYNSTSIEGTTFTKRETESVIFNKNLVPDKSLQEHLEVTQHAAILRRILKKEAGQKAIDALFIKELHQNLLLGIRDDAGRYSKNQRAIRGVNLLLTHPADIPEEIDGLLNDWNRHPKISVREIATFHAQFELIHPFGDGNGRVGRLLMVVQCLQQGYPPVVIENSRKEEYYNVLEYAQRVSEKPFILFLVDEMKKTRDVISKHLKQGGGNSGER